MDKKSTVFSMAMLLLATSLCCVVEGKNGRSYDAGIQKEELSGYADAEDYDRGVIGIKFAVYPGNVTTTVSVIKIVKGGPAELAGIKKNDQIVAVDGVSLFRRNREEIARMLRGKPGTKVTITVQRNSEKVDFSLMRGGLTELADSKFRSALMNQDVLEERDLRIRKCLQRLILTSAQRVGLSVSSSIPAAERMRSKEYCDEARFAIERGDYAAALKLTREAVKADPEFEDAQYLVGLLLDKATRYPEAEEVLAAMVARNPKSAETWEVLADCQQSQGKVKEAVLSLKKTMSLIDDPQEEGRLRLRIYHLMDNPAAATAPEKDEELVPSWALLREAPELATIRDAVALIKEKKYDDAVQKLEPLTKEGSCPKLVWHLLGFCQQMQERWGAAGEAYSRFVSAVSSASAADAEADMPVVLLSLGQCQRMTGKNADALLSFKKCLDMSPNTSQAAYAWQMIGNLQMMQGEFSQGMAAFRESVKLEPERAAELGITEMLDSLAKDLSGSEIGAKDGDNYFSAVRRQQLHRWVRRKPLKIYIADGSGQLGYKPVYVDFVRDAFARWAEIGNGCFQYKFVENPKSADIACEWVDDVNKLGGIARGGETHIQSFNHRIDHATIKILTLTRQKLMPPITDSQIKTVALHEVGHALGLSAHSGNPGDVMFPSSLSSDISARDGKTLQTLYGMAMPNDGLRNANDPGIQISH